MCLAGFQPAALFVVSNKKGAECLCSNNGLTARQAVVDRSLQQSLAAASCFCYLMGNASPARTNESRSSISTIRHRASHRHLSHHRVAILLRRARSLDEITDHRTHHRWRAFPHPCFELFRLSIVSRAIRRRELGASVTNATLRLGDGCNHHRDVDLPATLVRSRLFLGYWRHGPGRANPEFALRFP